MGPLEWEKACIGSIWLSFGRISSSFVCSKLTYALSVDGVEAQEVVGGNRCDEQQPDSPSHTFA